MVSSESRTALTVTVIPYQQPKDEKANEFGSTMTSTLPMAAVSSHYMLKYRADRLRCSRGIGKDELKC